MLSPVSDMVYMNYATPTAAEYDAHHVRKMVEHFMRKGRTPRLEFTAEIWPGLRQLLAQEGFILEAEQPTMVCTRTDLRPLRTPGVRVVMLSASDDLEPVLNLANRAFGSEELATKEQIDSNTDQLRRGTLKCAAGYLGQDLAGCAFTIPFDGVCELAGVGTDSALRRRGVASTVSTFLLEDHFQQGGDIAWLSAGDETSKRVYEGLGFRALATHVNYILPS